MRAPRGDSEQTKAGILRAARRLFAERGIPDVSVRDIAREAGVTHGLVHHYFSTKEQLAAEVIKAEIAFSADVLAASPLSSSADPMEVLRAILRHYLLEMETSVLLLARAQLAGFEPEKTREPDTPSSLAVMASHLKELQARSGAERSDVDPALLSVFVGAAVAGLVTMHPWLMASASLPPETYQARVDEIVEMGVVFICSALALRPA
jgi:AcrR family transcriptional regulator